MMYVPSSRDGTEMPVPTTVTRALDIGRPEPSSRSTPVIVPVVPWAIASTGINTATANDTIWRRRIIASFFSFRRWSLAFWSDEMQNGEVRRRELPPCRSTRGGGLLGHDPHHVLQHLHEPAAHLEVALGAASEPQLAVTEERHQRRMSGKDSNVSVVRGRDN